MKVYLVTGGTTKHSASQFLQSTETLISGSAAWEVRNPLPRSIKGLRAVTYNKVPFLFGKISTIPIQSLDIIPGGETEDREVLASIYRLDIQTEEWVRLEVNMTKGRTEHGVSIVNSSLVSKWCN